VQEKKISQPFLFILPIASLVPLQGAKFSECAQLSGMCVHPKKGDALLFYDLLPDQKTVDPYSLHVACPVIRGEKWSMPKWIHNKPFRSRDLHRIDFSKCEDRHPSCATWTAAGECTKNAEFMIGTKISPGPCRKACNACDHI
jgi:prolyl 4-hydroxylase